MQRFSAAAVFAAIAAFMAAFLVYPVAITLREAFVTPEGDFTLRFVTEIFVNPLYREGLANAAKMAVFSTAGAMLLAMPLALLTARYEFPARTLLGALVLVPLILPPFVGAIGIRQIVGQQGALNAALTPWLMSPDQPVDWIGSGRLAGVVIVNALHLYPVLYLNIVAALTNLDPAMDEAAANLGASPWRRFWRVTVPLAMPGIFAGASIVFIWSFTELGVPLMFDYSRVASVQIYDGIKDIGGNPLPYALVAVMLAASVLVFLLSRFLFGQPNYAGSGRAGISAQTRPLSPAGGALATLVFAAVIFLAVLPHFGVLLTAFSRDWYGTVLPTGFTTANFRDALSHGLTVPSIANSLRYAGIATAVDLVLGVAIAWIVVRTRIAGRSLLDSLAMLPLAVPGLVLAFGYLAMTRPGQPFAFLVGPGGDPSWLLIVAYSMRRLPYVVRSAGAGLQQTSVSLEEAARNLGCPPLRTLRRITLPLIAANLIAGALLAFSFAMLEVSDSLILAQKGEHFPITKAIYALVGNLGNGAALASALGAWAMVFLSVTLLGAGLLLGRKLGALFRA